MLVYLPPLTKDQLYSDAGATGFPSIAEEPLVASPSVPVYTQGSVIGCSDLNVNFFNDSGVRISPYSLVYAVGYVTGEDFSVFQPVGNEERIPASIRVGMFHPNFQIGGKWLTGNYAILWKYRVYEDSEVETKKTLFVVGSSGIYDHGSLDSLGYFDVQATVIVVGA